ncbi:MAG: hypothetical protein EZS28_012808 [Streblomastix strix]|uniref:Tc1-like transposase DDE domain-containing protein n=1 Tax=Streblomastix strix TaxID=222440 RepID=A0A5J4WAH6_9EUKA|nr:MAG: hypothetical protein EZS28_012808 [Streblomastix strix]
MVREQNYGDDAVVMVHNDNAPAHNTHVTQRSANNAEFSRIGHPPYSPYLDPCNFFLFGYMKLLLECTGRLTREQLMEQIDQILRRIPRRTCKATLLMLNIQTQ